MDNPNRGAFAPALPGTQGGPVQESPTMLMERLAQVLPNIAATGVMSYGLGTGNPFAMMTGGGGMLATEDMAENAKEPNIRDVGLDKIRMWLQGQERARR
jgi:hypothetical protein